MISGMSREDIRELVQLNVNRPDKDDLINSLINLGLKEISKYHLFKGTRLVTDLSIASDDISVAVPAGLWRVELISFINGTQSSPFMLKTRQWLLERIPSLVDSPTSGYPQFGYIEGETLYFFPKSNGSYTLRLHYDKVLGPLSDDNDTTDTHLVDEPLINWVTGKVFASIQQYQDASAWMGMFQSSLRVSINADRTEPGVEVRGDTRMRRDAIRVPINAQDPFAGLDV